jgi:hypothetical protein
MNPYLYIFQRKSITMFGSYEFGNTITLDTITIETHEDSGLYTYNRQSDSCITKTLSSPSNLLITPIEPVTQPKHITNYLLIELTHPLLLPPGTISQFFITFPIELGVFPVSEKPTTLGFFTEPKKPDNPIDTFTLTKPKYTLYGTPDNGIICKWWKSNIYKNMPGINPLQQGIIFIEIQTSNYTELSKLVFNAYFMKIYYTTFAYMHAFIKINNKAETSFKDEPLTNMKRAPDIFNISKLPVVEKEAFTMEWGL